MSKELDQENKDGSIPAVLLTESEIKKEDMESNDIYVNLISDEEEEEKEEESTPIPIAIPITIPFSDNLYELRCSSEPKSLESCSSFEMAKRRCSSVPKDFKETVIPIIVISDTDSDGNSDSESLLHETPVTTLKRKRSLIPSYIEVENTRKTMKPGPKSKTRNIVTVHQMITEAKMLRSGVTLDSSDATDDEMVLDAESDVEDDSMGEESDLIDDENESNQDEDEEEEEELSEINPNDDEIASNEDEEEISKSDPNDEIISISSSVDDETDHLEPEIAELIIGGDASTSSDDAAKEIALVSNNVIIDTKLSETLDDKSNETEVLDNVIDQNKIKDNNMENQEIINKKIEDEILKNNIIDQNKIEDKNMENKEMIIDSNEILKSGE